MKKLLMAVTILATGAVAYAAAPSVSTPVSVSLDVVTTSNVVLMDGAVQLTQIDLAHPQIMLTAAQTASTSSVVAKTFTAKTGDDSEMKFEGAPGAVISYDLAGITDGALELTNGVDKLESILALSRTTDRVESGSSAPANTITSTISPSSLNALANTGTYTGTATLNVTLAALTTK